LASPAQAAPTSPPIGQRRLRPRLLRPGWPLTVLYLGFPLWWVLGLSHVIFLVLAVPMAVALLRRTRLAKPPLFRTLVLFLAWMLAGVAVLWAKAPGTVTNDSLTKLVPFFYWAAWYIACTIVLLYVLNVREKDLPSMRVIRLLGFLFIITTVGGLAGVFLPHIEFPSLLEMLLPSGVTNDRFISNMIHPAVSSSTDFLGYEQARPTAPFAYANAWGNNLALLLPFFFYGWLGPGSTRLRRGLALLVLLAATIPIVYSLNRGVWLGVAAGAVFVCVRLALAGKGRALFALALGVVVVAATISLTPLGDTIETRIATPHSDERRASVSDTVVGTTWAGSPVIGYGSTRDLAGNFTSIAGGATADCAQCGAPPIGTQGFLWRLIFTTGFVGAALFGAFLLAQFWRHIRLPGPYALLGCTVLLMSAVFFVVYDSLESPMFTLMIGIALMNRERLASGAV
jgi:hypothetical protein